MYWCQGRCETQDLQYLQPNILAKSHYVHLQLVVRLEHLPPELSLQVILSCLPPCPLMPGQLLSFSWPICSLFWTVVDAKAAGLHRFLQEQRSGQQGEEGVGVMEVAS